MLELQRKLITTIENLAHEFLDKQVYISKGKQIVGKDLSYPIIKKVLTERIKVAKDRAEKELQTYEEGYKVEEQT